MSLLTSIGIGVSAALTLLLFCIGLALILQTPYGALILVLGSVATIVAVAHAFCER